MSSMKREHLHNGLQSIRVSILRQSKCRTQSKPRPTCSKFQKEPSFPVTTGNRG